MTASRARIEFAVRGIQTAVTVAQASVPQRWAFGRYSPGGWTEVIHQLLGDGVFAGDRIRTRIHVRAGAHAVVRGVAATPLRPGTHSIAATRIEVAEQASLIYLPGAFVPHAGASHASSLTVNAAEGARVMAATLVTPGRTAMGERGRFTRLDLRTRASSGGETVWFEDTTLGPSGVLNAFAIGSYGVSLALLCLGDWAPSEPRWWRQFESPGSMVGVSAMRQQGVAVRGLFPGLGSAAAFLERAEQAARAEFVASGRAGQAA